MELDGGTNARGVNCVITLTKTANEGDFIDGRIPPLDGVGSPLAYELHHVFELVELASDIPE